MTHPEALETVRQRRNWLTARIAAKLSVGWDVEWDTRERDALSFVLDTMEAEKPPARSFAAWDGHTCMGGPLLGPRCTRPGPRCTRPGVGWQDFSVDVEWLCAQHLVPGIPVTLEIPA